MSLILTQVTSYDSLSPLCIIVFNITLCARTLSENKTLEQESELHECSYGYLAAYHWPSLNGCFSRLTSR